ncbi:MAG: sigma-70 family RNA polymerase sigma factor [Bacteroidetes bacterium]|nr:sigma-70 family RNA polymerase sigma factor [Bacteroidota bacterium]MBS1539756.1 sigma-70 family RNA polymerase sigma factor [Bacteroidota bacterium]
MAIESDENLIQNALAGDLLAFKKLVNRHEGKVAGVVRSMLGQTPEAEDVGQEVFIRFYEALGKFRGDSAVSTYLTRIAINLSLNELKRRKRRFFLFAGDDEGHQVAMKDDSHDLNEMLTLEFGKLDADFRTVATLRLVEGYSTEETAELLGIPMGTVMSRLARAQKKLKEGLSKYLKEQA